ncbi:MAG: GGDEF domain-containing protein, partial [Spirochaetaceae bacterium]
MLGESLNFSIFYTFPIIFCTWFAGNTAGFTASGISVMLWISIEIFRGTTYPSYLAPVWETMVRLGYFLIIVFLLKALKRRFFLLEEMSLTDPLTGALNSRGFIKAIETQTEMARRN